MSWKDGGKVKQLKLKDINNALVSSLSGIFLTMASCYDVLENCLLLWTWGILVLLMLFEAEFVLWLVLMPKHLELRKHWLRKKSFDYKTRPSGLSSLNSMSPLLLSCLWGTHFCCCCAVPSAYALKNQIILLLLTVESSLSIFSFWASNSLKQKEEFLSNLLLYSVYANLVRWAESWFFVYLWYHVELVYF